MELMFKEWHLWYVKLSFLLTMTNSFCYNFVPCSFDYRPGCCLHSCHLHKHLQLLSQLLLPVHFITSLHRRKVNILSNHLDNVWFTIWLTVSILMTALFFSFFSRSYLCSCSSFAISVWSRRS